MENGEFKGFFMSMSPQNLREIAADSAFAVYSEERMPHHEKHGNEEDLRLALVVMSVSEMEALVEHFRPMAEAQELPQSLCPFISEIASLLASHMTFQPLQQSGDPNNN